MKLLQTALARGDFVNAQRIKSYSIVFFLGFVVAIAALLATADGLLDYMGRPLGTDFANVWAAGAMVLSGKAAEVYNPALHWAEQQSVFGKPDIPFYGWHYPPFFLLVAGALAFLPYLGALVAWQAATLAAYAAMIRLIVPGTTALLVALAFPAVFVNLIHGQNGFLTAALFGAGLSFLDRRPLLAGVFLGLLAYKPHFGLLLPLVLLVTARWRPLLSAAATVLAMAAVTTLTFGTEIWRAFLKSTEFTSAVVLEAGSTGWEKIHSVFSLARSLGCPVGAAYALHGATVLGLAAGTVWLWRRHCDLKVQSAGLVAASVLVTPYALDYDLTALAPAIAFLVADGLERGFRPFEKSILAFAWAAPLFSRGIADVLYLHPGLVGAFMVFFIALSRAAGSGTSGQRDTRDAGFGQRDTGASA